MRMSPVERLFRHNTQMSPGTLGGRLRSAAPVRQSRSASDAFRPVPRSTGGGEPVFDFPGPLIVSTSGIYDARGDETWTTMVGRLIGSGTTDTEAQLLVNGTPVATLTIPDGENRATEAISPSLAEGDDVQVTVSTPGTGAVGLTVQLRS